MPTNTSTPLKFETDFSTQSIYKTKNDFKTEVMTQIDIDNNSCDSQQKSIRKFLGNNAVAILLQWFHSNKDYPYPDEATTDRLAKEASKIELK